MHVCVCVCACVCVCIDKRHGVRACMCVFVLVCAYSRPIILWCVRRVKCVFVSDVLVCNNVSERCTCPIEKLKRFSRVDVNLLHLGLL